MTALIRVVSWGSSSLDSATVKAHLRGDTAPLRRSASAILTRPHGRRPRLVDASHQEAISEVWIRILTGDADQIQTIVDLLGIAFAPGSTDTLTVDFSTDASKLREQTAQVLEYIPKDPGPEWVRVRLVAADARWRGDTPVVESNSLP